MNAPSENSLNSDLSKHKQREPAPQRSVLSFDRPFDLDLQNTEPRNSLIDAPFSDDIHFDYIKLDLQILNNLKKTNFWDFVLDNVMPRSRFGEVLNVDTIMTFYPQFEEPLLKMRSDIAFLVEKLYNWILKISEADPNQRTKNPSAKIRKLIIILLEKGEPLITEIYLTAIKFIRTARNEKSDKNRVERIWHVMACLCSAVMPAPETLNAIFNYLVSVIDHHPEDYQKDWARYCLKRLSALEKNEMKRTYALGIKEIEVLRQRRKYPVNVYL